MPLRLRIEGLRPVPEGGGIGRHSLEGGRNGKDAIVEQSNSDDCRLPRIDEMPVVEVHTVSSATPPTRAGEPAAAVIAPALANALFGGARQCVRRLSIGAVALLA